MNELFVLYKVYSLRVYSIITISQWLYLRQIFSLTARTHQVADSANFREQRQLERQLKVGADSIRKLSSKLCYLNIFEIVSFGVVSSGYYSQWFYWRLKTITTFPCSWKIVLLPQVRSCKEYNGKQCKVKICLD